MAIVPLHQEKHAQLKVKSGYDLSLVENRHLLPLVMHEVVAASIEYPVLLAKNPENNKFQFIAMMGLEEQENLFMENSEFVGSYMPGIVTNYPFRLGAANEERDKWIIVFNDESSLINEDEGEALFDENGEDTEYFKNRKKIIGRYYEQSQQTDEMISMFDDLGLLKEQSISVNADKQITLTGIHTIDEEALYNLPDEKVLDLHKRGILGVIYAQLRSLGHIRRLSLRKIKRAQAESAA